MTETRGRGSNREKHTSTEWKQIRNEASWWLCQTVRAWLEKKDSMYVRTN